MDNTLDSNYKKQQDSAIINSLRVSIQNNLEDLTRDIKNLEERIEISKKINFSNTELAIKMAKWGRNNPYGFISEKEFEEIVKKQFNEFLTKKKTTNNKERNAINFFKKHFESLKIKQGAVSGFKSTIHQIRVQFNYTHEQAEIIANKAMKELDKYWEFL